MIGTERGHAPRARFTLHVVATADGFIARQPGHTPADWASPEEQALFSRQVALADWSVMGRGTHEAAPRPQRRRVILSRSAPRPEWRSERHLWLDPAGLAPDDLPALVEHVRPMREAAVLGGVGVHHWFLEHGRLDEVLLTMEPVRFKAGLGIFPDQAERDPIDVFRARGFRMENRERLNARGTELIRLLPCGG